MSGNKSLNLRGLQKKIFLYKRFIYKKINQEAPLSFNKRSMNFPNYFAYADSNFKESDIVIFGVPYDKTSTFREGSRYGPMDIREASWNYETYNFLTKKDLKNIKICDYGNIKTKNDKPEHMIQKVKKTTSKIINKHKFPIILGGEHSLTSGAISAYKNEDLALLFLDAHLDYRDEHMNEKYNHACTLKRASDFIDPKNIAVLGLRSADKKELEKAKKNNIFMINSFEIYKKNINYFLEKLSSHFKSKKIYLTLDIDVLDPCFAPGVSTPEPFGITPFDVIEIINHFSSQLVGFDVVETCPPYDNGETALLAAKFVKNVIEQI